MSPSVTNQLGPRVAFLTSGRNAPSSRYRVLQFIPHLRKLGLRCSVASSFPEKYEYFPWMGWRLSRQLKRLVRRVHLWRLAVSRPDVVVVERELFDEPTCEFEEQLRGFARKIVLDIDDGVFLRYPAKFERLAQLCDGIIAGNPLLAEHFRQSNPHVALIPTCVDMDDYPQRFACPPRNKIVVGWIGTPANLSQLSVILPALKEVARQTSLELLIITSRREALDLLDTHGIPIRFARWSAATAIQHLQECDIGIMPLELDDPWNRYKCGLKLIEYMAIGIPAVASPVGVNSQIVTGGVDGYLATTTADWIDALMLLAGSAKLREQIGTAARQTVIQKYSIQVMAPELARLLREFAK